MIRRLTTLLSPDAGRILIRLANDASAAGDQAAAELLVDLAYVAFDIRHTDAPELESQLTPEAAAVAHSAQLIVGREAHVH